MEIPGASRPLEGRSERPQQVAQLAAEACAGGDPTRVSRACAALRDALLEGCERGALSIAEARTLCRQVDDACAAALARFDGARDHRAETRLQGALRTFQSLIDASPLPIVSIDLHGLVQIWNRAAEELFGWSRAEATGRRAPILAADDADGILAAARAGEVVRNRELRRARRDGTPLELVLSMAPLRDAHGEVEGSIAILTDIADRKRHETELAGRARFREQFVGIVGHDLRNPLTAILTSADLLLRYASLDARQSRVVGRIAASAERMARMIDDLLDFARTRLGGTFPIQPRRIDLRELTENAVEELLFAHPGREVQVDACGDLWGSWDPDRMSQVVSNLVGNALQHSQDGEVHVTLRGERDVVVLETHNGGPPIPREMLPHVFEPGRRGDARAGGLGLGLFIVQQIVLAHGGSIEVRSSDKDGTLFTVALPRRARRNV